MIDLSRWTAAFAHLPEGVTAAEVNAECIEETTVQVKGGVLIGSEAFTRTKLYVRAGAERTGMVYTEKLDEDPLALIARAAANAAFSTAPAPEPMNAPRTESLPCPEAGERIADLVAFGAAAEAALPGGELSHLSVTQRRREIRTVNAGGLDVGSASCCVQAHLIVLIPRAQGVAEGEVWRSAPSLQELDPVALAAQAYAAADEMDGGGLPAITIPSGSYRCVLSAQVVRNLMMTGWQTLSGETIRRGASSVKAAGERIGSEAFTVRNVPAHPLCGERWLTDSEGTRVPETTLVAEGVLVNPLCTLSSAQAAGTASTGSAGRVARMTGDVPIALTTVPALLYLAPGTQTREDLVRQMGTGLLLTYSLDLYHAVNVASGEFSMPCGGIYYENGKPVGAVSQITMAGDLLSLWKSIEAAGSDLGFDPFYFHTYEIGSPSVLVSGLTIAS